MSRRTWLIFPVALVAFVVLAAIAATIGSVVANVILPQRPVDDFVSFNPLETYTLNDTVTGDVFVTGTTIDLTSDSHVQGDVSLVGEDVTVSGRIDGDLTVIAGGVITLDSSAQINGDVLFFGDRVEIGNAQVAGDLVANGNGVELTEETVRANSVQLCSNDDFTDENPCNLEPLTPPQASPLYALYSGLTLAGVAGLAVVVFPRQIGRMEDAIRRDPRKLGVMGFGVLFLALGVSAGWLMLVAAVPAFGVLLIPLIGFVLLMLLILMIAGWITLSLLIGDFLMRVMLKITLPALLEAIAGTAVMLLLLGGISLIPFGAIAALPIMIVLTSVGVGAAISTRLGRRPLRGARLIQG